MEDGRIEGVKPPEDLPDPERWRFVPWERMPEGNLFRRLFVTSFVIPIFSFESDVGAGGGVGLFDLDFRHQGRIERFGVIGEHTTEGQQNYGIRWERLLAYRRVEEGVFHEERNRVFFSANYRRPLTLRYFGRGDDTKEADESSYADEQGTVELGLVKTLPGPTGDMVLETGLAYVRHNLGAGAVSSVPTTELAFPQDFAAAEETDAIRLFFQLTYDTRDSFANPYAGVLLTGRAELQPFEMDGVRTNRFHLAASWAFPVPPLLHRGGTPTEWNPPTDVIAVVLRADWITGDGTLYNLPSLGGSRSLRGYINGRWRDRAAAQASLEYRPVLLARGFPLPGMRGLRVERVGAVFFLDVGTVAPALDEVTGTHWKLVPGVGLRFLLERDSPLRVDVGFSDEGAELSIRFGQAF